MRYRPHPVKEGSRGGPPRQREAVRRQGVQEGGEEPRDQADHRQALPPEREGKIEGYHKILWRELISRVAFSSLAHFKTELRKFDRRYNEWREQEPLDWNTPASIYLDSRYFNKKGTSWRDTGQ
jgi:transposase InsO family protein